MNLIRKLESWWGGSLRHRLLASSILTLVFFLVLLGYLSLRVGQESLRQEVNRHTSLLATKVAKEIHLQLNDILDKTNLFTRQLEILVDAPHLQAEAMRELRKDYPLTYRAMYLFNGTGHIVVHVAGALQELTDIEDIKEILDRPNSALIDEVSRAYEEAKSGYTFLSPVHVTGPDRVPVLYLGVPITIGKNQPDQVLVAEIDLREFWRRIDETQFGQTGRAFVLAAEGAILAHPDRAYIGKLLVPELRKVLNGYEGQSQYTDPINANTMLASYSPVGKRTGWAVVVEQELEEAFAPAAKIAAVTLTVLLIAIGMATTITFFIARSITSPIQYLVNMTLTIARTGDLSHDIAVTGQDEAGQLALSFNRMIASLRRAEQEVRAMNEELELRVDERTAQLEAINRELEIFAYVVSHDLKAPLRAIIQLAGWIAHDYSKTLDENGKELISLLSGRAGRMNNLIDGILQYSRVGKVREKPKNVDLERLVRDVIDMICPPEHIRITIENRLPVVKGRKVPLEQVFHNLLGNAVKHMDKPNGEVKIHCLDEGSHWRFGVSDNGPGIDKRYHEKIFQLFQTLTPRDEFESTGIGLSLVKKIVERSEGRVWVESEIGKGSTFHFTLPKERKKVKSARAGSSRTSRRG